MRLTGIMLFSLLAMLPIVTAQAQADAIQLQTKAAEALRITEIASDLAFPMGMIPLPDGSLLVATSPSASGNFYNSTGALLRLDDSNGDGSLDQQTELATDLPGSLVAVTRYKDIVVATSAQSGNEQIMFFRRGEHWRDPLVQIDSIRLHFVTPYTRVTGWQLAQVRRTRMRSTSSSISAPGATTPTEQMCVPWDRSTPALIHHLFT